MEWSTKYEKIIEDYRNQIRRVGFITDTTLQSLLGNICNWTQREIIQFIEDLPCDDIHLTEYQVYGTTDSYKILVYNPQTEPMPKRT